MGMCLLMFLLPILLITGSNSITSSTGLGYLGKCRDGYDGNPCLHNGCKDDGECVQGTTPGSNHGFYPQGMEGSAGITCGCNPNSKLIIGGMITLLITSASFLIYKGNKELKENELNERLAEQLNELNEKHAEKQNILKERYAEQQNKFQERYAEQQCKFEKTYAEQQCKFEKAYAEQKDKFEKAYAKQKDKYEKAYAEQRDKFEKAYAEQELNMKEMVSSHSPSVLIRELFSWLASNEGLLRSILEFLELSLPQAKPFCLLLKSVQDATVSKRADR